MTATLTHLLATGDTGWEWARGALVRGLLAAAVLTLLANLLHIARAAFWVLHGGPDSYETGGRR